MQDSATPTSTPQIEPAKIFSSLVIILLLLMSIVQTQMLIITFVLALQKGYAFICADKPHVDTEMNFHLFTLRLTSYHSLL